MDSSQVRKRFLDFFEKRGHVIIPSAPLVPENDPSTLFTGSGMQPLVPYLLGKNHPAGARLVNSQKCFRSMDIEEVGDNRHTTFFEMLGNWSLGDYFKEEQLSWFFEFLTDVVKLPPEKLYVTVFAGDEEHNIPKDAESVAIWKKLFAKKGIDALDVELLTEEKGGELGMQGGRIFSYGAKKNWWSRAGEPANMPVGEPGGPDSEVFYCFEHIEHDSKFGLYCHPNCDCGRFMEIGNSVFMQYIKKPDGSFDLLPKQNVDFGGGLERITAASNGEADVFKIDIFKTLIDHLEKLTGKRYEDEKYTRHFRIIADHLRSTVFMIADGVEPGNTERNYFARRLLRRAIRSADVLGMAQDEHSNTLAIEFTGKVLDSYGGIYFLDSRDEKEAEEYIRISTALAQEEIRFRVTLRAGMKEFEKLAGTDISGKDAFTLFSTYGFPFELMQELAAERGMKVNEAGFQVEMEKHQEISRAGVEQKFRGGLADTSEKTTKLHTTHHLLLKALQIVLGPEVKQRGSNITQERLRMDFSYPTKMTKEQIAEAERIVNEKIAEDLPMIRTEMPCEEAEMLGAEHEFGAKYPDRVSVYSVGPKDATEQNPQFDRIFSIEFCGGPHVEHTGLIGENGKKFKIVKEEAVSAGVRRIRGVVE